MSAVKITTGIWFDVKSMPLKIESISSSFIAVAEVSLIGPICTSGGVRDMDGFEEELMLLGPD